MGLVLAAAARIPPGRFVFPIEPIREHDDSAHVGRFLPDRPQDQPLVPNNTRTGHEDVRVRRIVVNPDPPKRRVAPRRLDRHYMQIKATGNVLYNAP